MGYEKLILRLREQVYGQRGLQFAVVILMMCRAVLEGLKNYVKRHGYDDD